MRIENKLPVIYYGEGRGLQNWRGGASQALPLQKGGGGAETVLALLKGGGGKTNFEAF